MGLLSGLGDTWARTERAAERGFHKAKGLVPSIAQERAARSAREEAEKAQQYRQEMWEQAQETTAPYLDIGTQAGEQLMDALAPGAGYFDVDTPEYTGPEWQAPEAYEGPEWQAGEAWDPSRIAEDPGYQFRLQQGQKAIERAAAAKGGRLGGSTLKELMRYGQGLASEEAGESYGRWAEQEAARRKGYEFEKGLGTERYLREMPMQYDIFAAEREAPMREAWKTYEAEMEGKKLPMESLMQLYGVGAGAAGAQASLGGQFAGQQAGISKLIGQAKAGQEMSGYRGVKELLGIGADMYGAYQTGKKP